MKRLRYSSQYQAPEGFPQGMEDGPQNFLVFFSFEITFGSIMMDFHHLNVSPEIQDGVMVSNTDTVWFILRKSVFPHLL